MEMHRLAQERGECSGVDNLGEFWKTIWGLNARPVLKNSSWKVRNNILPSKENLFRKKIVADPWGSFCHIEPDTIYHCLWGCPAAIAVWQEGGWKLHKMSCAPTDGKGLVMHLERFDPEELVEALA